MVLQRYVIIVAGGSGTRMGSDTPKQFLLLHGEPVLMHTIRCFYEFDAQITIVVALPNEQIEHWQKLCNDYNFTIEHTVVKGGITRFHSVKNALAQVTQQQSLVAVHDGVRPLVSKATIQRCFDEAERTGSAIPVIEPFESVRQLTGEHSISVNRSLYRLVQTPQVFSSTMLLNAYQQPYLTCFTDDASVVEHAGNTVALVEGNRENIKITTPLDLSIAEFLLQSQEQ